MAENNGNEHHSSEHEENEHHSLDHQENEHHSSPSIIPANITTKELKDEIRKGAQALTKAIPLLPEVMQERYTAMDDESKMTTWNMYLRYYNNDKKAVIAYFKGLKRFEHVLEKIRHGEEPT